MSKKIKVIIYCRVSKRDMNPENQLIELKAYADREALEYEIFQEKESTRNTRPIKQEVLQRLRSREYDALLVWKLDRWGRSLQELVADLKELTDKGIKFISLKDNIDYTTASGQLFANMLSCFAEYERAIIRERTMAGLDRARAENKSLGRPKGSKDKKQRRKSGYYQRWSRKSPP